MGRCTFLSPKCCRTFLVIFCASFQTLVGSNSGIVPLLSGKSFLRAQFWALFYTLFSRTAFFLALNWTIPCVLFTHEAVLLVLCKFRGFYSETSFDIFAGQ